MSLCKLLASFVLVVFITSFLAPKILADNAVFTVTVGNSPPTFTVAPIEESPSDDTTPTNVGTSISFTATATDPNAGNYYFIVCKTNQVQANNGTFPSCPGGQRCLAPAASSGTSATCRYAPLLTDNESEDWFAFACDSVSSGAACSAVSQGTGSSGAPLSVNHPPSFDVISNDGNAASIGSTITWSTSLTTTDTDIATSADTVKLIVCKTTGLANGDCDGGASDRYCQSELSAANPSCSYIVPIGTPSGTNSAYVYVVDSHNMGSTSNVQGTDSSFNVTNTSPQLSSIEINEGESIVLTEGTTTPVISTVSVSDANGCQDISTVKIHFYRSGINKTNCIAGTADNNNNCYSNISCAVTQSGNTCTGAGDTSATFECPVNVSFIADPTDTSTQYPSENWLATIVATDLDDTTDSLESSTGVELNSLSALTVDASIDYGTLTVGQKNDPIDRTLFVTSTGNVGIDLELSGVDLTNGLSSIPVGQQKYALTSVAYDSATALTSSPASFDFNCLKSTSAITPATKSMYWGIAIPTGIQAGNYTGTNTITAVKSEVSSW